MTFLTIHRWSAAAVAAILVCGWAADACAQGTKDNVHAPGGVHFSVSCSAPAQAEFDRGVALLHHMTYPQARETFHQVARIDPQCAMAHWGIAMTLFQPLWPTRPGPGELRRGREAVQRATSLKPSTDRERLFIEAAAAFFAPDSIDYWERIRRWQRTMQKLHSAFPGDAEATTFLALAHLAAAPSNDSARVYFDDAAQLLL